MSGTITPTTQIMEALGHAGECPVEDLLSRCPGLTWNQLFLELDRLSRTGEVHLWSRGSGQYIVSVRGQSPAASQ